MIGLLVGVFAAVVGLLFTRSALAYLGYETHYVTLTFTAYINPYIPKLAPIKPLSIDKTEAFHDYYNAVIEELKKRETE